MTYFISDIFMEQLANPPNITTNRNVNHENVVFANPRQKGNPVIQQVTRCWIKFTLPQEGPDYIFGGDRICALFISMRYHLLHRDYLIERISECPRRKFAVRILLCFNDLDKSQDADSLVELTSIASANDFTVLLFWSEQEGAR